MAQECSSALYIMHGVVLKWCAAMSAFVSLSLSLSSLHVNKFKTLIFIVRMKWSKWLWLRSPLSKLFLFLILLKIYNHFGSSSTKERVIQIKNRQFSALVYIASAHFPFPGFLFAEDLYRAKDVASENDDQLPHLSFQFCYFTAEVLVSSLVAQPSLVKEQGWKRGSST